MACFGSLFRKKPFRFGKGKGFPGTSKRSRGTSKNGSRSSKRPESSRKARQSDNGVVHKSPRVGDNSFRMTALRKKIMSFREFVELPPCVNSSATLELVKDIVKELHKLYADVVSVSDSEGAKDKAINALCVSIKSLGKHWMHSDEWMVKSQKDDSTNGDLAKHALALLDDIIKVARERRLNMKEDADSSSSSCGKSSTRSSSDKAKLSSSPSTPTLVLPEFSKNKSLKACSKV